MSKISETPSRRLEASKNIDVVSVYKTFEEAARKQQEYEANSKQFSLNFHSYCKVEDADVEESEGCTDSPMLAFDDIDAGNICHDQGTQCDPDPLLLENQQLRAELQKVKAELQQHKWNVDKIRSNVLHWDSNFYCFLMFVQVCGKMQMYLSSKCKMMVFWRGSASTPEERTRTSSTEILEPVDQLLMTLMRLRLGLYIQDIADRFGISIGTCSHYFTTWICLLYEELKPLNIFPSREIVKKNMPSCFYKYPHLRVILDCTEIFVQRSSSLINQNLTFSHYKHHNTLKFLIGITPLGIISFVSEAYGGRISDRKITMESGILDLLQPGDNVMADKGFTISDLLQERKCTLNIPPFLGSSKQFSTVDILKTQEIAELRIHVERAIGRVKNFHIFDGVLPLSLAGIASKMFQVCCWITNMDVPLVDK